MMSRRLVILSFAMILLGGCFSVFANNKPIELSIKHFSLPNKSQVFFVKRTSLPIIDVEVVFSAGSLHDKTHQGLAALTNNLIGEDTKDYKSNEVAYRLESIGARYNQFINQDMSGFTLRTLTKQAYLDQALKTLHSVLVRPKFNLASVERVKKQMMAELKLQQQNPWYTAKKALYHALYQQFPYGNMSLGNIDSIQKISINQIERFYKKYFTGQRCDVILVGDINQKKAKNIAEEIVRGLPKGNVVNNTYKLPTIKKSKTLNVGFATKQSTVMIGGLSIDQNNSDYFPLMVGNAIFGGLPMTSILYQEIREKRGLAYVALSSISPLKLSGTFVMAAQTQPSNNSQVISLLKEHLKSFIHKGPTAEQLVDAKQSMSAKLPLNLSSNAQILSVVGKIAFYYKPLNYLSTYVQKVNGVTAMDIQNAFKKYVHLNKMVTIIVGPHTKK